MSEARRLSEEFVPTDLHLVNDVEAAGQEAEVVSFDTAHIAEQSLAKRLAAETWERVQSDSLPKQASAAGHSSRRSNTPESRGTKDSVGLYLDEIGRVPLLTGAEEIELSKSVHAGQNARIRLAEAESDDSTLNAAERRELRRTIREADDAKDRFIKANLRLVVSVARKYPLPPRMEFLDLVQEGNLGLEHAVDKFDWQKGFKFSTYATFWIRQAIGRAMDQKGNLIRLPGDRGAELRAAIRAAETTDEPLEEDMEALRTLISPSSLNSPVGEEGTELGDLLASPLPDTEEVVVNAVTQAADDERAFTLLRMLDQRQRYAVDARFGFVDGHKQSYREVGAALGITAEAARRQVKRSIQVVKAYARQQG